MGDKIITPAELAELAQVTLTDYDVDYLSAMIMTMSDAVRKWTSCVWNTITYTAEQTYAHITKAGYLRIPFRHGPVTSVSAIRQLISGTLSPDITIDDIILFGAERYALLPWFSGGTAVFLKGGGWEPGDAILISMDYSAGESAPAPVKLAVAWLVKETLLLDNPDLFPDDPNPGTVISYRSGDYAESKSVPDRLRHVTGLLGRGTSLAAGAEALLAPYRRAGVLFL